MFKILLLFVLLYFALKASANLLRAVRQDPGGFFDDPRMRQRRGQRTSPPPRRPPQRKQRATRYAPEPDVEDATWEDL